MSRCCFFFVPPPKRMTISGPSLHAIPRSEVDPELEDAGADAFDARGVALLKTHQRGRDLRGSRRIEVVEPVGKGARTVLGLMLPDYHDRMVS
jgi:hypothetical protein